MNRRSLLASLLALPFVPKAVATIAKTPLMEQMERLWREAAASSPKMDVVLVPDWYVEEIELPEGTRVLEPAEYRWIEGPAEVEYNDGFWR